MVAELSTECILELYRRYERDLKAVRRQQYWFHRRHSNVVVRRLRKWRLCGSLLNPALDDLEAEITYLLIRDRQPKIVVEMSPNAGWSTTWILSALRDNGGLSQLWSFDLHDTCTMFVPKTLAEDRWHFVKGDARETIAKAPVFDYLFVDSDHSEEFAEWYIAELFPRLRPGIPVSVHDVFHEAEPSAEGLVVLRWLRQRGLTHWTPSLRAGGEAHAHILAERSRLGIDYVVHRLSEMNPMLFFQIL